MIVTTVANTTSSSNARLFTSAPASVTLNAGPFTVEHGLKAAGTKQRVLAVPAMELLFRASRGIPRVAANLLRSALVIASHRDQSFVDETVMHDAIVALSPEPPSLTAPKPRKKPGTKSR